MVGRDAAKRVLARTATAANLNGPALAWFVGWGERWLTVWTKPGEREYTLRAIEVMARNAAGFARKEYA